jgi:predicted membrane protein
MFLILDDLPVYGRFARLISLIAASILALMILIYPLVLSRNGMAASHGILSLIMLGVSSGFIHGVGYTPESTLWRQIFHPLLAWGLMLLGFLLMLDNLLHQI